MASARGLKYIAHMQSAEYLGAWIAFLAVQIALVDTHAS